MSKRTPVPCPERLVLLDAGRFVQLDALRGGFLVWMAVFHFCFDLSFLGLWPQDFYRDPFWTLQRSAIVSGFLFVAGLSQAVAQHQGQSWPAFWRRWVQISGCALLVTAGSYLVFPRSFIFFGVLHGIALMLIVMRLTGRWPWPVLLGLAAAALASPYLAAGPTFDAPALQWLGLMTHKPITEDYVPLLPWVGVMWLGLLAGRWALARRAWPLSDRPAVHTKPLARFLAPLALLGRWSLSFYMLHQPVMIGALMALQAAI